MSMSKRDAINEWQAGVAKAVADLAKTDKGAAEELKRNPLLGKARAAKIARGKGK